MRNEYLKPSEVARELNVCNRTVINMILEGKLKALTLAGKKRKTYRILAGELDRFAASEYERQNNGL